MISCRVWLRAVFMTSTTTTNNWKKKKKTFEFLFFLKIRKLVKGNLIAYRTLGLIFCRNHSKQSQTLRMFLSHFYRIISVGLCSIKHEIIMEIVTSCYNIFTFNLPGSMMLVFDFLREIEVLVKPQSSIPSKVKQHALLLVKEKKKVLVSSFFWRFGLVKNGWV